jgi:hypothetical protein
MITINRCGKRIATHPETNRKAVACRDIRHYRTEAATTDDRYLNNFCHASSLLTWAYCLAAMIDSLGPEGEDSLKAQETLRETQGGLRTK